MFMFFLAILLFFAAAGLFIFGQHTPYHSDEPVSFRWAGFIPLVLALIILPFSTLRIVDAGTTGVPVTFGTVGDSMSSGVHFVAPWTGVENIDIRTTEYTMSQSVNEGKVTGDDSVEVKGNDGATGHVDSTTHYHVDPAKAGDLFKNVGEDFQASVVRTGIRNCIHNAFGGTQMVVAATTQRTEIQGNIDQCVRTTLEPRGLVVEDFQIRNVRLEGPVQDSINSKVAAQQAAEAKQFELQGATLEAQKSNINNKAVSDGQQIIKCGGKITPPDHDGGQPVIVPNTGSDCQNQLTPEYLQWAYIDMMKSISNSPNHDTIIIPAPTAQGQGTNVQVQVPAK